MEKVKRIYTDDVYQYLKDNEEAVIDYCIINDIDPTPNNKEDAALQLIDDDCLEVRELIKEFDKKANYSKILVVGSLGLWYGKRQVKAEFNDLFTAFYKCVEDVNNVYFKNNNTTLQIDAIHHDGTNQFKLYKIVNGKQYAIKYDEFMNY